MLHVEVADGNFSLTWVSAGLPSSRPTRYAASELGGEMDITRMGSRRSSDLAHVVRGLTSGPCTLCPVKLRHIVVGFARVAQSRSDLHNRAVGFQTPLRGVPSLRHCAPVITRSSRVAQSGALGLMVLVDGTFPNPQRGRQL